MKNLTQSPVLNSSVTDRQMRFQDWTLKPSYLVLAGGRGLLHHVPVGEGGHRGRVSGLLGPAGTADL